MNLSLPMVSNLDSVLAYSETWIGHYELDCLIQPVVFCDSISSQFLAFAQGIKIQCDIEASRTLHQPLGARLLHPAYFR